MVIDLWDGFSFENTPQLARITLYEIYDIDDKYKTESSHNNNADQEYKVTFIHGKF